MKRREIPPPDVAGVRRALELARQDGHDLHAAMHLIAYTGLRRGEALALLWRNVDLQRGFLAVEGSLVRRSRGVAVEPPKTATSRRLVDLDPSTVEVLAAHRDWQARLRADMREAYVDNGRVFVDEYGGWASPQRLYKAVKTYGQRAGVPSAHCPQPAPLPRHAAAPERAERRRGEQAPGPLAGLHDHRHLRPRAPRLAARGRRSLRRGDGKGDSEKRRRRFLMET